MFLAKSVASEHKDLIHDVSFDYHGRRMATCSSDHTVKVIIFFFWHSHMTNSTEGDRLAKLNFDGF